MKLYPPIFSILFCLLLLGCGENMTTIESAILASSEAPANDLENNSTVTDVFLSLADVHLDPDRKFITYRMDTGWPLWEKTKQKVEAVIVSEKPEFMVYLGDLPAHFDDNSNRQAAVAMMLRNLDSIKTDIPIFYLPGNNDSPGGDYHSFTKIESSSTLNKHITRDTINPFTRNNPVNEKWPILNIDSSSTKVSNIDFNSRFGYYSAELGLKGGTTHIIALNTVIFCRHGGYLHYEGDDGISQQKATIDQYNWFESKMHSFSSNDRVLIMMHIPPGKDGYPNHSGGYNEMWNDQLIVTPKGTSTSLTIQDAFLALVDQKRNQIKGILTSHTHLDGLRRIRNAQDSVVAVSFSTPGITVNHSNNPGFKTFKYLRSSFDLIDYTTYYAVPDSSSKTDFKFGTNQSFTFGQSYGKTSTYSTMYEDIKSKTDAELIAAMRKTMYLKSGNEGKFNFAVAMDVN